MRVHEVMHCARFIWDSPWVLKYILSNMIEASGLVWIVRIECLVRSLVAGIQAHPGPRVEGRTIGGILCRPIHSGAARPGVLNARS